MQWVAFAVAALSTLLVPAAGALTTINNGLAPPNPANVIQSSVPDLVNVHNVGCSDPNPGCASPGAPTLVLVTSGAAVGGAVIVFESSSLVMDGGTVTGIVGAVDSASVTVLGGQIGGNLASAIHGSVSFSGGEVSGNLGVSEDSTLIWSGGVVGGVLLAREFGVLTVRGSSFIVNGVPFGGGSVPHATGSLAGVLEDGSSFSIAFERDAGARILAVPEPLSIHLFALAALVAACRPTSRCT